MNYSFHPMSRRQAEEIASWHYDGEYSFYDMEADPEDLQEFLKPDERADSNFAVIENRELIGFYCFTQISNDTIDIGLGMKPSFTGKGQGLEFLEAGLDFAKSLYHPEKLTLSVAAFNKRAIKVYKRAGFREEETFLQKTNGSQFEFVKMKLALIR